MTLFGKTLDAQAIASLVFMLMVLALWIGAWRGERGWTRWLRTWEAGRRERRLAEQGADDNAARPSSDTPRGPWG